MTKRTFNRKFYAPSEYDQKLTDDRIPGMEVFVFTRSDKLAAMGFSGKRQKPDFNYNFRDAAHREEFLNRWINAKVEDAEVKAKQAAERKAKAQAFVNPVKVGDIFNSSWGYDQTRNYFYQVVKVTKKMVYILELNKKQLDADGWSWTVTADKDNFAKDWNEEGERVVPEPKRYKVGISTWTGEEPKPFIRMSSYEFAYLWDGEPQHDSGCH